MGLTAGQGADLTIWALPWPAEQGHTIICILGHWFESGGQQGGGPHEMGADGAAAELGVPTVQWLGNGPTSRQFYPYNPLNQAGLGSVYTPAPIPALNPTQYRTDGQVRLAWSKWGENGHYAWLIANNIRGKAGSVNYCTDTGGKF